MSFRAAPIKDRALFDPCFDQGDLFRRKRIILLRHPIIGIRRGNQLVEFARCGISWNDRFLLAVAAFHKRVERFHAVTALRLFGVVAGQTFICKNRRNFAGKTHPRGRCRICREKVQDGQLNDAEKKDA